jgi:hypothetical protein
MKPVQATDACSVVDAVLPDAEIEQLLAGQDAVLLARFFGNGMVDVPRSP